MFRSLRRKIAEPLWAALAFLDPETEEENTKRSFLAGVLLGTVLGTISVLVGMVLGTY